MSKSVPALSLWRPWTELVLCGAKPIENRTWPTPYRGPLIVHAASSANIDRRAGQTAAEAIGWHPRWFLLDEHVQGAYATGFLGVVDVVDCCDRLIRTSDGWPASACECGPWAFAGHAHWRLANPRRFAAPIPGKGRQKIWTPDDPEVQAAAAELVAAAA